MQTPTQRTRRHNRYHGPPHWLDDQGRRQCYAVEYDETGRLAGYSLSLAIEGVGSRPLREPRIAGLRQAERECDRRNTERGIPPREAREITVSAAAAADRHRRIAAARAAGARVCLTCGCTDDDCSGCIERTGEPCHWVDEDLCSACAPTAAELAHAADHQRRTKTKRKGDVGP